MRKQENIGYAVVVVAVLLCLLGTIGLRLDGEVNDIPTPNVPERTFFADEPLPEQAFGAVISATLTLNWDRDDIYVVIAGEDEKKSCESLPSRPLQRRFNHGVHAIRRRCGGRRR